MKNTTIEPKRDEKIEQWLDIEFHNHLARLSLIGDNIELLEKEMKNSFWEAFKRGWIYARLI